MKKSNRYLAKTLKKLSRLDFTKCGKKYFDQIKMLKRIPFDIFDLEPNPTNYVYRAVINNSHDHYREISRIRYNPNPQYISRANLKGQAIAYYACASDIALIEACHDKLYSTNQRVFKLTVSKWKICKKMSVQIICSSSLAQRAGTDLSLYYEKCRRKRFEISNKLYRTWFLKTRFMAEQFAKETRNEMDYYITAKFSSQLLKKTEVDAILYPSIRYLYKGFNYAFSPKVFEKGCLQLCEVSEYKITFHKENLEKYPLIEKLCETNCFDSNKIIWE